MKGLLIIFLFLPFGLLAGQIEKGPFIQQLTSNSAVIVWETVGNFSGSLKYGVGTLENEIVSPSKDFHHEIFLTNLLPNTIYDYALFSGGQQVTETFQFKTFAGKDAPFVFIVYGDNRTDHESHAKVVAKIAEEKFDFLINTGDLVASGDSEEDWSKFFEIENSILHSRPLYPTIGNHEEANGDAKIYKRIFSIPKESSGLEEYYAFTIGNSRFIVLDGHVKIKSLLDCLLMGKLYDECFDKEQTAWVKKELENSSQDKEIEHIFVVTHVGPYSSKPGRTGSAQMRDLLDEFADAGVDLIFSGHDHFYEHGITVNGLHYFVTGGGGAPLYKTEPTMSKILFPHEVIKSVSVHHYLVVTVAADYVKVVAKDIDGNIIDTYEYGKKPECVTAEDCKDKEKGYCEGYWECSDKLFCIWKCHKPPKCETPADCYSYEPGECLGFWACSVEGECYWLCDSEKECLDDKDCEGFEPPAECPGSFRCENYLCVYECEAIESAEESKPIEESSQAEGKEPPSELTLEILQGDVIETAQEPAEMNAEEDKDLIFPEISTSCGCYQGRVSEKSYLSSLSLILLLAALRLLFSRTSRSPI